MTHIIVTNTRTILVQRLCEMRMWQLASRLAAQLPQCAARSTSVIRASPRPCVRMWQRSVASAAEDTSEAGLHAETSAAASVVPPQSVVDLGPTESTSTPSQLLRHYLAMTSNEEAAAAAAIDAHNQAVTAFAQHQPDIPEECDSHTLLNPNSIAAPHLGTLKWYAFLPPREQTSKLASRPPPFGTFSEVQMVAGAGMISNMIEIIEGIRVTGKLPYLDPKDPLQSRIPEFEYLFSNVERLRTGDKISLPFNRLSGELDRSKDYMVIFMSDHAFKIPLYKADGSRISIPELTGQLLKCSRTTFTSPKVKINESVGFYNSLSRPLWVPVKEMLQREEPTFFETIDKALFTVSFDNYSHKDYRRIQYSHIAQSITPTNRYYGKALSLIVSNNGSMGALVNPGAVPGDIATAFLDSVTKFLPGYVPIKTDLSVPLQEPEEFTIRVKDGSALTEEATKTVLKDFNVVWNRTTLTVTFLPNIGMKYLREVVGLDRPDAYINLVACLAYYRVIGKLPTLYSRQSSHRNRYPEPIPLSENIETFIKTFDDETVSIVNKRAIFAVCCEELNSRLQTAEEPIVHDAGSLKNLRDYYAAKTDFEMQERIATADGICQGAVTSELYNNQLDSDAGLFTENFGGRYNNGGMAFRSQFRFRMESSISPTTPSGLGIGYAADEFGMRLVIMVRKIPSFPGVDARYFRYDIEKAMREMSRMSPMRSEIWGTGYQNEQLDEHRKHLYFTRMKKLSDDFKLRITPKIKEKYVARVAQDLYKR